MANLFPTATALILVRMEPIQMEQCRRNPATQVLNATQVAATPTGRALVKALTTLVHLAQAA
jgi:hypothetical protein